ncbi:GNAT family N-acetyltransferase [Ktedonospora formicarum]|uniref:Alanine acetyltransferase n=1 Tax=Ktedonospora formicarum TaxID=2778364 RepID=A0A8J3MVK2_9CHLR|nr:GNAT family N-acetyltransferase [Ktedonospora formicarum]GHO49420.1 alanine acetyltransferase [Ktedonospora formicarum]
MDVLETDRLILRHLTTEDAAFILALVNDPAWLRYIGDNGVRTLEDARSYIVRGPIAMYAREGFGLYLTALKEDRTPIGLCGLIKRDALEDVDIGFAFLPQFRTQGYGYEAASAVLTHGRQVLGLQRIVAITSLDNERSAQLLEKLGLHFERRITLHNDPEELRLFTTEN